MDINKQFPEIVSHLESTAFSRYDLSATTTVDLFIEVLTSNETDLTENSPRLNFRQVTEGLAEAVQAAIDDKIIKGLPEETSSGLPELDAFMAGGYTNGQVSEIFGVSGSGKSHFVGSALLAAHNDAKQQTSRAESVVICTERALETRRLIQMSGRCANKQTLQDISTIYCSDLDSFDHIIFTQLAAFLDQAIIEERHIRMIVIDSIGHHLRGTEDFRSICHHLQKRLENQRSMIPHKNNSQIFDHVKNKFYKQSLSYKNRSMKAYYLMAIHAELAKLARKFLIPIIVTNQVSDFFEFETDPATARSYETPLDFLRQIGFYSGWSLSALRFSSSYIHATDAEKIRLAAGASHERSRSQCAVREEFSNSMASLGIFWSRLATSRIRLLKCHEDNSKAVSHKSLLVRPLLYSVAYNYSNSKPMSFEIRREGIVKTSHDI